MKRKKKRIKKDSRCDESALDDWYWSRQRNPKVGHPKETRKRKTVATESKRSRDTLIVHAVFIRVKSWEIWNSFILWVGTKYCNFFPFTTFLYPFFVFTSCVSFISRSLARLFRVATMTKKGTRARIESKNTTIWAWDLPFKFALALAEDVSSTVNNHPQIMYA